MITTTKVMVTIRIIMVMEVMMITMIHSNTGDGDKNNDDNNNDMQRTASIEVQTAHGHLQGRPSRPVWRVGLNTTSEGHHVLPDRYLEELGRQGGPQLCRKQKSLGTCLNNDYDDDDDGDDRRGGDDSDKI